MEKTRVFFFQYFGKTLFSNFRFCATPKLIPGKINDTFCRGTNWISLQGYCLKISEKRVSKIVAKRRLFCPETFIYRGEVPWLSKDSKNFSHLFIPLSKKTPNNFSEGIHFFTQLGEFNQNFENHNWSDEFFVFRLKTSRFQKVFLGPNFRLGFLCSDRFLKELFLKENEGKNFPLKLKGFLI